MIDPGDEVHRAAAACVKVGVKRIAVRIDGYQHPLTVGIAFKNQLLRLHQYIAVAAPAQRFAACAGMGQRGYPSRQVVLGGRSVGSPLRLSPSMPHSLP